MQNPYIEALAQGGSVANQGLAQASNSLSHVADIFNSSASLAMKMNVLLEQEEARKQQELMQTAQFMHQVQQDNFMNKYRQDDLNFRKENADRTYELNQKQYSLAKDKLSFEKDVKIKNLELRKTEDLLKYGSQKTELAQQFSDKYFKLLKGKNDTLAEIASLTKQLNSPNLTVEQRNSILAQIEAKKRNISLFDQQINSIQNQLGITPTNIPAAQQTSQNTNTSNTTNTLATVGSNETNNQTTSNNITKYPSIFNNQKPIADINATEIKSFNDTIYADINGKPITIIKGNDILEQNLNKVLSSIPQQKQKEFLLGLSLKLGENVNFDTGKIENLFPKIQNSIDKLTKYFKDPNDKKAIAAVSYVTLADKIGKYPDISDKDKFIFGLKVASKFNNPKVLNEVSKGLGLPVKATEELLKYKDSDFDTIYLMANDQGTVSSMFENIFHFIGLNHYDIQGKEVNYKIMKTTLFNTIKELTSQEGANDYNLALAIKHLPKFSDNTLVDHAIKVVQLYGFRNHGGIAEHVTEQLKSKNINNINKKNINIEPTINAIKNLFSTQNINPKKEYSLPVIFNGKPTTIKMTGEEIINAYNTDILIPKFIEILKDGRLEPTEIIDNKNLNNIDSWINE